MSPVAGVPAQGTTHVFTIRPGHGADDTRAYTTRKPHRKSKLGCGACKAKRVKCDERKPQCGRCVRTRSLCQYEGGDGAGGAERGAVQQAMAVQPVQRLPASLSRVPTDQRLLKHYDVITSQALDTITFSNILAGERSPQYRAMVMDQAKQHPHLMHSMFAVSALHLNHVGKQEYRRDGLTHLQVALPKFRESIADVQRDAISPQQSPHILYSAMLITLYYFCIDNKSPHASWVFSSSPARLDWLAAQQGLAPLFGATKKHHTDSFMTPVFKLVEGNYAADCGLPPALLDLCDYTATATQDQLKHNPYVPPLQQLNALMPLERNIPNLLKYLRFMASFDKRFFDLIKINDPRALLIMGYGFALMCNIELWWTQPRAQRDCWAICSYLDQLRDPRIRALLGFPARACGYETNSFVMGARISPVVEEVPVTSSGYQTNRFATAGKVPAVVEEMPVTTGL